MRSGVSEAIGVAGMRRGNRRRARLALLAGGLMLALLMPEGAAARWTHISRVPSDSSPYLVCPRQPQRARCALIQDPTRGTHRRGPLPPGAITKGPEQEVSPAVLGSGVEGGYSPEDLRSAYALPPGTGGSGQTVAVVDAYDDPNAQADLNVYRAEYGLPACTEAGECFRKVDQAGGTKYPVANGQWAKEIALDLDMVSAVCPNCHILLVEASSNLDTDLAAAEEEAATLGATEMSNSFVRGGNARRRLFLRPPRDPHRRRRWRQRLRRRIARLLSGGHRRRWHRAAPRRRTARMERDRLGAVLRRRNGQRLQQRTQAGMAERQRMPGQDHERRLRGG